MLARAGDGLSVPFRITAEPVGLSAADLPFATGPAAPPTNGRAALTVGLRDPGQSVAFAREAGLVPALAVVDSLPGIVKPNLTDLGPAATLTSADARTVTARTTPPDPGDWDTKLNAIDTFSGLIGGLDISRARRRLHDRAERRAAGPCRRLRPGPDALQRPAGEPARAGGRARDAARSPARTAA